MSYESGKAIKELNANLLALVGAGCTLPGNITSISQLIEALKAGRDCITEVPPDRWNAEEYYDPDPVAPGKTYVRHGGFVSDIDRFDASFFGISDAEAVRMDPQQRMLLQTVWHALEDAGQGSEELVESDTGVFVAMMNTNGYSIVKGIQGGIKGISAYDAMGDAMSIAAGRIAHFLGLEGPCFALDTACSGSLVALHLARQSILAGDCNTAIVAGVNAILHPNIHIAFSKMGLMSRVGRCAAFDAQADGYIRGEGCVAIILRRQTVALERGDRILASIVGTAINQDGRTPALTAPNGRTQEKVISRALARAGLSPNEIGYVEAHGTGTPVGDPIEMSALANVYGPDRSAEDPLYVGSVKSNFGHIESAAGLLGLLKTALSLDQEVIFPSIHYQRLNPNIDLGHAPVRVAEGLTSWPRGKRVRAAGVNSFGYSGTNAHAILREAPLSINGESSSNGDTPTRSSELVVLSTKSQDSLRDLVDEWIGYLTENDTVPLRDIAFTAATGRTHLMHRLALVGRDTAEINDKLRLWREGRTPPGVAVGQAGRRKQKAAFVFTGQGAQYAGMGRELYEQENCYRDAIARCASLMDSELGVPLCDVLFGPSSATLLADTRYVQPALFALEYALADLIEHWGVKPDVVIGHSVGEIVAAAVAGALSLEDAVRIIVARGRLMGKLPRTGKMLAVQAELDEVNSWIANTEGDIAVASINGPNSIVVSGDTAAVDAVAEMARSAARRHTELNVSHAFHSPLMDPILSELDAATSSIRVRTPRIPVISNLTGDYLGPDVDKRYWSTHVRQTVRFYEGMKKVIDDGCSMLIEVGPHPAMTPMISSSFDMTKLRCIPTLMREGQDVRRVLETVAALFANGIPLDLQRLYWRPGYRRVSLPLYPFRRKRHWIAFGESEEKPRTISTNLHPLVGRAVNVGARRVQFESTISASSPWVDHRILGSTVFPGTAYLEMATRGFAACNDKEWQPVVLRDVVFERPLLLSYGKPRNVTLTLEDLPTSGIGEARFTIEQSSDGVSETFCRGRVAVASEAVKQVDSENETSGKVTTANVGAFYADLRKLGLEYGASFAVVRELWLGKPDSGEATGRIAASPFEDDESVSNNPYLDAVILDGCLQVFAAAIATFTDDTDRTAFIPASVQSITFRRQLPSRVWSRASVRSHRGGRAAVARIEVFNDARELLVEIDGVELRSKASLAPTNVQFASRAGGTVSREELLKGLSSAADDDRVKVLTGWLCEEIKDIMGQSAEGLDLDNIEPSTAFLEIGLDSLLVTELQRRIQEKLNFRFQPMQGLDYQSIESLADYILSEVLNPKSEVIAAATDKDDADAVTLYG